MMRSHGRIFLCSFIVVYLLDIIYFLFHDHTHDPFFPPFLHSFHHSSAYVHVPTQRTYSAFLRDTLNLLPLLCICVDLFHILTHNTIVIWSNILCMVVKAGVRYIGVLKWPKQEIANMID